MHIIASRWAKRWSQSIQRQKYLVGSSNRSLSSLSSYFQVNSAVQEALSNGEPVVALESTIVAHGMPYPQNLETAESVESIVRSKGAVPATIAVMDGSCRIGLSPTELQDLAKAGEEGRALKCSTRELSLILAKHSIAKNAGNNKQPRQWGATTVASTMTLAHAANISCFVTGGIGGVHREGERSMDVSADLTELSRTPVVVVSAGIKSILDIVRTLEVLETNSVPTVAYRTDEFPCFFSPNSGVKSPARVDSADEVASAYWAARALQLAHGMLVAVPPPNSAGESIEQAIQEALEEANKQGLRGQAVTPFILKSVAKATGGDSLRCNIALVQNNAEVGSDIAVAIAKHRNATAVGIVPTNGMAEPSRIICMGGTVLDIVAKPTSGELLLGTSNPASCVESDGGVARNVAEVLGRLGSKPLLYSAVGNDDRGLALRRRQAEYGIQDSDLTIKLVDGSNTATFLAVLEGETNDLHTACADMEVMSEILPPSAELLAQADILLVDANASMKILTATAIDASKAGVDVFFEPTSVPKAILAAQESAFMRRLAGAFPNFDELIAMRNAACGGDSISIAGMDDLEDDDIMDLIMELADELLECMSPEAFLVVTLGDRGVCLVSRGDDDNCIFPVDSVTEPVIVENSTGAGDTLCGAFLHAVLQGRSREDAVAWGMKAAAMSLRSADRTIAPELSDLTL